MNPIYRLKLTLFVVILVILFSGFSYFIPGLGSSRNFYIISAPFNVSVEDNIPYNFGLFLVILALTEIYLRGTHRNKQALYVFASIIVANYVFQDFFVFLGSNPITGTSGIGSGALITLILIVYSDLLEREKYFKTDVSIINLLKLTIFFIFAIVFIGALLLFFFSSALINNNSAILHILAGIFSVVAVFNVLKLTGMDLDKKT